MLKEQSVTTRPIHKSSSIMVLERRVNQIIRKVGYRRGYISENAKLKDDLGFDTIDILQMCNMLEYQFNIQLNDKDIIALPTVKSIVGHVSHKILKN